MPRAFAYSRASTIGQTTDNQLQEIRAAGFAIEPRRIVAETISGSVATTRRPGFARLPDRLKPGDVPVWRRRGGYGWRRCLWYASLTRRGRSGMAKRDPRSRRLALCGSGPCLCAVLVLVAPAVAGGAAPDDFPDWLAARLRATTAWQDGSAPAWVARYEYDGRTVYYLPPRCCDVPSELYDAAGDLLCRPDGGFVDGDERCPDFLTRRRGGEIVWPAGRGQGSPSTSNSDRGTSADTR